MESEYTKLEEARKRVGQLKKFYSHITIFIVINIALVVLKLHLFDGLREWGNGIEFNKVHWTDWEIISTPLIWGAFLIGHGISVYSRPMVKRWEQRQIQRLMDQDNEKEQNQWQ